MKQAVKAKSKAEDELDISIFDLDINNLDKEWVAQPHHYYKAAKLLADARRQLEEAKANQDVTLAEVNLDVRTNFENYGLSKVTEDSVKTTSLTQDVYLKAQRHTTDARHRVDVLTAFVTALEHRKRALEKLVDLFGMDYYSAPRAPAGAKDVVADMEKKAVRGRTRKQPDEDE